MVDQKDPPGPSANSSSEPTAVGESQGGIIQLEQVMSGHERGMLVWTRVVGAFTFVLAAMSIMQWVAFVESERAYLVVDRAKLLRGEEPQNVAGGFDVVLVVKNVGKHTARVTKHYISGSFHLLVKNMPDVPDYSAPSISFAIPPLAPESERELAIAIAVMQPPPALSIEQAVDGIKNGRIPSRLYGYFEYDIGYWSWRSGRVDFCFEYIPVSQRLPLTPPEQFHICQNEKYTNTR